MILATSIGTNIELMSEEIKNKLGNTKPLACFVFASINSNYKQVGKDLKRAFPETPVIGATSGGGQFIENQFSRDDFVVGVIGSEDDAVSDSILIEKLDTNTDAKLKDAFSHFYSRSGQLYSDGYKNYTVLLLSDAFSIDGDTLVKKIRSYAGLQAYLAGGFAGDDFKLQNTYVIYNDMVIENSLSALAIYSKKNLGIGVKHGGIPLEKGSLKVTKSESNILYELNGKPALDVYIEELEKNGIKVDRNDPAPTLALYELGIPNLENEITVRAPLQVLDDKSIVFAGQVPQDRRVVLMNLKETNLIRGAVDSIIEAKSDITGDTGGCLIFSCAARLMSVGDEYANEVEKLSKAAGSPIIGYNTYGEIGRKRGQFVGFHNTTVVSVAFPRA